LRPGPDVSQTLGGYARNFRPSPTRSRMSATKSPTSRAWRVGGKHIETRAPERFARSAVTRAPKFGHGIRVLGHPAFGSQLVAGQSRASLARTRRTRPAPRAGAPQIGERG
jgi:hypothetical protein